MASGFSHRKLGNVDGGPSVGPALRGFVVAFAGATFLSSLPANAAEPWVTGLLLALGAYVAWRSLGGRRPQFETRPAVSFLPPMGVFAGARDPIGEGGLGAGRHDSMLSSGRLEELERAH